MKSDGPEGRRGRGRPKGSTKGGLRSAYTIKMSPEYRVWLGEFAEFLKGEMSDVFREGARLLAERRGFRPPPLK